MAARYASSMSGRHYDQNLVSFPMCTKGEFRRAYLWGFLNAEPVIHGPITVFLRHLDRFGIVSDLRLQCGPEELKMPMKSQFDRQGPEEFIGHHGHLSSRISISDKPTAGMTDLMLCEPLWILVHEAMEQILDADHVKKCVAQELEPLIAWNLDPRSGMRWVFERRTQQARIFETIAEFLKDLVGKIKVNRVRSLRLVGRLRVGRKVVCPACCCMVLAVNENRYSPHRHVKAMLFPTREKRSSYKCLANISDCLLRKSMSTL